jgi:hypothetical protein
MKTVLIFCLCFIITNCVAQNKGDNTILVKGVTFDQVVNALLDKGYKIDKLDKDFKTVKTEYCECRPKYSYQILLNVRVKDSVAAISGKASNRNIEIGIENQKWGLYKYSFDDMNNLAKSLKGELSYSKN